MKANIIAVFDKEKEKVLVCRRRKNPYKGLLNFVGGKIEREEDGLTAAYRNCGKKPALLTRI
ncbi:MAG: NUDIX hydrolase [Eisenbergiella massiliensis]